MSEGALFLTAIVSLLAAAACAGFLAGMFFERDRTAEAEFAEMRQALRRVGRTLADPDPPEPPDDWKSTAAWMEQLCIGEETVYEDRWVTFGWNPL